MGRFGPSFDPDPTIVVRPGPVLFDISNQSRYAVRFSIRRRGRTLARTPIVAPGSTAQLKTTLIGAGLAFYTRGTAERSTLTTSRDLRLRGRLRTGDGEVTQP